MNLDELPKYEPPACANCGTMAPEVMVPRTGLGTQPCCWLCAHVLIEHAAVFGAPVECCGCTAEQVYPASVISKRRARAAIAGEIGGPVASQSGEFDELPKEDRSQNRASYVERPQFVGRDSERWNVMKMRAVMK